MPDNSRESELLTLLQAREEENRRLRQEVASCKAEAASFKAEVTLQGDWRESSARDAFAVDGLRRAG